jgi:hypothetical protein
MFIARERKMTRSRHWDCRYHRCPCCFQEETLGEACPTIFHIFPKVMNVLVHACSNTRSQ